MNVSIFLVWIAITAIAVDFGIYFFSHKYRKYGGHIIGIMAYIVLLADLTYALYLGLCGTDEFRRILAGALVVGALFAVEYIINTYRHIRHFERGLALRADSDSLHHEVMQLKAKVKKLTEENERMLENFNRQAEEQRQMNEIRNERMIANEEFEKTLPDEEWIPDTREGFQLYALLVSGYEGERGPKYERKLHNICEKICSSLDEKEVDALLQIDIHKSRKAGEYYDIT